MSKKLFDKKCVFCMWDDALRCKDVFVADSLEDLMKFVEAGKEQDAVVESAHPNYPFLGRSDRHSYRYCYYDPLYAVKKAYYKEGKVVQYWDWMRNAWEDSGIREPMWHMRVEYYRVKPHEGDV